MSTNDLAAAKKRALATYAAFCNKSGVFPRTKNILDELATHQCEVAEKAKDKELEVKALTRIGSPTKCKVHLSWMLKIGFLHGMNTNLHRKSVPV